MNVGDQVKIARPLPDADAYRATSAVPHVGLEGEFCGDLYGPPAGKSTVKFFQGDLGYEPYGTRENPDEDDWLYLYIMTDCLEAVEK